jgi:hypothetical protein
MWCAGHWCSWSNYLSNGEFIHNIKRIHSILIVNWTLHIQIFIFWYVKLNLLSTNDSKPKTQYEKHKLWHQAALVHCSCVCNFVSFAGVECQSTTNFVLDQYTTCNYKMNIYHNPFPEHLLHLVHCHHTLPCFQSALLRFASENSPQTHVCSSTIQCNCNRQKKTTCKELNKL